MTFTSLGDMRKTLLLTVLATVASYAWAKHRTVEEMKTAAAKVLAMEGRHVTSAEGIIDKDVDRSIHNLTVIGADAMCATDQMVLDIMTRKS